MILIKLAFYPQIPLSYLFIYPAFSPMLFLDVILPTFSTLFFTL